MRIRKLKEIRHVRKQANPAITGWTATGKPFTIPGVGGGIYRVETEEIQIFDDTLNAWVIVEVPTEEVDVGIVEVELT